MLVFISGGVRSGKSSLGEDLAVSLAGENRKVYLATARFYDREMAGRIEDHRQKRADKGFLTLDQSSDLGDVLCFLEEKDTVLLDCLGTLLANEMFDREERPEPGAVRDKVWADILKLRNKTANLIVVSNEIFGDGIVYDEPIESYIRVLGELHCRLAEAGDTALECVYSGYQCYKGTGEFHFGDGRDCQADH